jgi:hypothetical protein
MTFTQNPGCVLKAEALGDQQHLEMKQQVRRLAEELVLAVFTGIQSEILGADDHFACLWV